MRTTIPVITSGLLMACGPAPRVEPGDMSAEDPVLAKHIAEFIEAKERIDESGVAVAVVHDGKLIHLAGYGLRDREAGAPVTADTLFGIGSSSKSFAGLSAVLRAQAGEIDLEAPVRNYAPDFALQDETISAQITITDLLSHRTGLSSNDALFFVTPLDRDGLFERMRYLDVAFPFRERFQYNNLTIMAAAVVVGRSAKSTWEEFATRAIFEPLGMSSVALTHAAMLESDDHAIGYRGDEAMRLTPIDDVGPAGAINASARDMARWIAFLASRGETLLEPEWFESWTAPRISATLPGRAADYALGWLVGRRSNGDVIVEHDGGAAGFLSHVSFRPATRDAVFVISNQHGTALSSELADEIYDYLVGRSAFETPTRDVLAPFEPVVSLRDVDRPTVALEVSQLLGSYEHPAYGRVTVELDGDALIARRDDGYASWQLVTIDGLSFYFTTDLWLDEPFTFEAAFAPDPLDPSAPAGELRIAFNYELVSSVFTVHPAIVFKRIP